MRAILSLVLIFFAVSCSGDARSSDGSDGPISVVASFYPLAYAAEQIGDGRVEVTNLTPPGVEPHDLELSPDDLEAIADADVVLFAGGGFQPSIEEAVETAATGVAVDVLEGVDLRPPAAEDEGDPLEGDPHVWLDPSIYADIGDRVAAALRTAGDAADGPRFDRAAEEFRRRLSALDRDFREGLADCATRVMITSHGAFGYLAAAYDLQQEEIAGLSPASEPDPRRIGELADEVRAAGVRTIFTEDLVSPELAETLAAEAGIGTAVLSPLEGLTEEQLEAGEDFMSVMRRNLETLRDGLDCA
jgi:zinc transport system substrate-binding protein